MQRKHKLPENVDYTFETERLIIRPIEEKDMGCYISLYMDSKIMKLIGKAFDLEEAKRAFIATLKAMIKSISSSQAETMTWAITEKNKKNKAIGIIALSWRSVLVKNEKGEIQLGFNDESPEIGIMLSRTFHGKKIPYEAGGALLEFTLRSLNVSKINTFYKPENIAVESFIKKLQMIKSNFVTVEGERNHSFVSTSWLDGKNFLK